MARIIWSWQRCQLLVGNIANVLVLPPKNFFLKLPNSVRNAKKLLEAMPLAMLPTKSLQHCQDQMIRAIILISKGEELTLKKFNDFLKLNFKLKKVTL